MHLLLNTSGIILTVQNGCFEVTAGENQRIINPKRVHTILITSKVSFDSSVLKLAFKNDVPIYFIDKLGAVTGVARKAAFNNASLLRRNQVLFAQSIAATNWTIEWCTEKIEGQAKNIEFLANRRPSIEAQASESSSMSMASKKKLKNLAGKPLDTVRHNILGVEGSMAKLYWQIICQALPDDFKFETRSKNPATDKFNAVLNYLYGILYTVCETALYTAGLDPQLGIFHTDQYQKPTLAFDLIEAFRPMADRFLVEEIWQEKINVSFFNELPDKTYLNKEGKAYLIPRFLEWLNERTTHNDQITTRQNHINRKAGALALQLLNFKN
jgi:CRISPR-associated protein Cas1